MDTFTSQYQETHRHKPSTQNHNEPTHRHKTHTRNTSTRRHNTKVINKTITLIQTSTQKSQYKKAMNALHKKTITKSPFSTPPQHRRHQNPARPTRTKPKDATKTNTNHSAPPQHKKTHRISPTRNPDQNQL